MHVIATPNDRSPRNFQRLISVMLSMKCISRNFYIDDQVRSIMRPLHYKSMGENVRSLLWTKAIRNALKNRVTGRIDSQSRYIAISDLSSCRQGHFRSWKVTSFFGNGCLLIRDQLERWKLIDMFRTMIRIDWYAAWPFQIRSWPWPEVNFSTWPI